jgi:hypothetical protein
VVAGSQPVELAENAHDVLDALVTASRAKATRQT